MINSLFQFNFEDDQQEKENAYPISDVQWIYINDINQTTTLTDSSTLRTYLLLVQVLKNNMHGLKLI